MEKCLKIIILYIIRDKSLTHSPSYPLHRKYSKIYLISMKCLLYYLPRTHFLLLVLINSISHILRIFHKICQLFREYIWEWTQTFSWWLYRVNTFTKGWISWDEITMWTAVESYYGFRIRSSGKQLIAYSHSHLVFLLFALNFMPNKSSKKKKHASEMKR